MTTDVDQRKSGGIVSVSGNAPAVVLIFWCSFIWWGFVVLF